MRQWTEVRPIPSSWKPGTWPDLGRKVPNSRASVKVRFRAADATEGNSATCDLTEKRSAECRPSTTGESRARRYVFTLVGQSVYESLPGREA